MERAPRFEALEQRMLLAGCLDGPVVLNPTPNPPPGVMQPVFELVSILEDSSRAGDCILNAFEQASAVGGNYSFQGTVTVRGALASPQTFITVIIGLERDNTSIASRTVKDLFFPTSNPSNAEIRTAFPENSPQPFTLPVPVASVVDGLYRVFALRGTVRSGESSEFTISVDSTPPTTPTVDLISDTGTNASDNITNDASPTFLIQGLAASDGVELLRNGMPVAQGPAGANGEVELTDPAAPEGTHAYVARVSDTARNTTNSPALSVTIDVTPPAAPGAPDLKPQSDTGASNSDNLTFDLTPTFTISGVNPEGAVGGIPLRLLRDNAVVATKNNATGPTETLTDDGASAGFPTDGAHTYRAEQEDLAGNVASSATLTVTFDTSVGQPSATAPGTPVFSTVFDLESIRISPSEDPFILQPWQISFDRTTQTFWFSVEHGTRMGQFDPATGRVRIYDLAPLGMSADNPHGIFFDFETHITPRVWVVHRNAGGLTAGPSAGSNARLTYLDVAANEMVTYDFASLGLDITDLHAVFVDDRGTVWASSDHGNRILEFDFDSAGPGSTLNARTARLTVHDVPREINVAFGTEFSPHGLEVVIDDTTGEPFVWFVAEGGSGRAALLRPGAAAGGLDLWAAWDVAVNFESTRASFVAVDTHETPGRPEDDTIVYSVPVATGPSASATRGLIHEIAPAAFLADPSNTAPSPISTWQIPNLPDGPTMVQFGATNQPYVDREGVDYFADRLGNVGRFDSERLARVIGSPALAMIVTHTTTPPVAVTIDPTDERPLAENCPLNPVLDPARLDIGPFCFDTTLSFLTTPANSDDHSPVDFLDQYPLAGMSVGGDRGAGAFRGFLNAGGVFYGSLSQNDDLSTTVFAETARRQMTAVDTGGGGRMAFQALRDGTLVLTVRRAGEVTDRQIAACEPAEAACAAFSVIGDASAVLATNGVVHAFARNRAGGIVDFQCDRATTLCQVETLPAPGGAILVGDPSAFVDQIGPGAFMTTDGGHLLVYRPGGANPTDLTAALNDPMNFRVYSSVGSVYDSAQSRLFAYGTNQQGDLIEYCVGASCPVAAREVGPGSRGPRDTMVFQSVAAILSGTTRHVFATDGSSRLVHIEAIAAGDARDGFAENVTEDVAANSRAFGYFPFQQPFVARVYTELDAVVETDGTLHVYGTNARDLVEFTRTGTGAQAVWTARNLTNDTQTGQSGERVPANKVFGAPAAYLTAGGDRRVVQINADGEVIEYAFLRSDGRWHTQNITRSPGLTTVEVQRFTTTGTFGVGALNQLELNYEVKSNVSSLDFSFYSSGDPNLDSDDPLLGGCVFADAALRSIGRHTVILTAPACGVPVLGAVASRLTDQLVSFVLAAGNVDEVLRDADKPLRAQSFAGIFHQPASPAALAVRGLNNGDDTVALSVRGTTARIKTSLARRTVSIPLADISQIRVLALGGNDSVRANRSFNLPLFVDAGDGDDVVVGGSARNTFLGGNGNDTLVGGAAADDLRGGAGHDVLCGLAGADQLFGDGGNDTLAGGAGSDMLSAGAGTDDLRHDLIDVILADEPGDRKIVDLNDAFCRRLLRGL